MPDESASDTHPAVLTLKRFLREMHDWEAAMIEQSKGLSARLEGMNEEEVRTTMDRIKAASRSKLQSIFEEYCEAGAEAKRLRTGLYYGAVEPSYNPDKEVIQVVSESGQKVIVETQMTHELRNRLKYELVRMGDSWKIRDNRKFWAAHYNKWHRMDL
jgi:hypothetical protein